MGIVGNILRALNERAARNLTLEDLRYKLEKSKGIVATRLGSASNSRRNVETAKHIIGLERWGQRRLQTLLGDPPVMDEYDPYRPEELSDLKALREVFLDTREATLNLVNRLQKAKVDIEDTAKHNELGDLTLRAWLRYLDGHALRETLLTR